MSDKEKQRPSHRVSFSAFERDRDGKRKLGNAREIGAIWPRRDKEGGILRFDHTPEQDGIYFVNEVPGAPKQERPSRGRNDRER